jgi:hypothetical protein
MSITNQTIDLRSRAMLATLNISVWNPKKKDTAATLETLIKHGASREAGAFVKNLLPEGAIDRVKKSEGVLRSLFYKHTLPWRDDGIRILPSAAWEDFSNDEREAHREFDTAVGEFLVNYDAHRNKARVALNGLFNESDYPPVEVVRTKFGVRVSWFPLPDSTDFRVDLPQEIRDQLGAEIDSSVKDSMKVANDALYERLSDALGRVVERLDDGDKVFRNTLITNLRDLCVQIPKLNVMGDETILRLVGKAEKIANLEPDQIRADETVRQTAHKTAGDILAAMGITQPVRMAA